MFKLILNGKQYDVISANIYNTPSYTMYNGTAFTGLPLYSLILQIIDADNLWEEYRHKICQDILQQAALYDESVEAAYILEMGLRLKQISLNSESSQHILELSGDILGNILLQQNYNPPKGKRLGFFDE